VTRRTVTPVPSRRLRSDAVLVIGLGRYGSATAEALHRLGHEVMAVERSPELVQEWSGRLTHVVEADSTNLDALKQIGAQEFEKAVVGVGTSVENSVLTAANLVDLQIPQVWAKAISLAHGRILDRIGVHHVVYPERDAGERTAHLVTSKLLDYIEFDDGFAIVKMRPPKETIGFTLAQTDLRKKYGVTVVGVKPPGENFTYAVPETKVHSDDLLIVSGHVELVERFASRP
jgi:trk system potassium uptake protein TrkA